MVVILLLLASFCYRLRQLLPLLYVTLLEIFVTLLYIITHVKTYKTQAFYPFYDTICNIVAKIILKYFNSFALCIV